jgi:DNA-binding NarL/FixJ family response regulator
MAPTLTALPLTRGAGELRSPAICQPVFGGQTATEYSPSQGNHDVTQAPDRHWRFAEREEIQRKGVAELLKLGLDAEQIARSLSLPLATTKKMIQAAKRKS